MSVSIVIPNFNGAHHLEKCLSSLEKSIYTDFQVVVVDNCSTDHSRKVIENYSGSKIWVQLDQNYGFARASNEGWKCVTTEYVMMLNNDTVVDHLCLQSLVNTLQSSSENIGGVQPLMLSLIDPQKVDDSGDELSWYGLATKSNHGISLDEAELSASIFSPSGGATLFRRSFLEMTGGYDEHFESYLEDVDLGLRGRLMGYSFLLESKGIILHLGGGSNIKSKKYVRLMTRNRLLIFIKNIPLSLLLKHLPKIIYGQLFHFFAYHKPISSIFGLIDFLLSASYVTRHRRLFVDEITLTNKDIDSLLSRRFPSPSLVQVVIDFHYNILRGFF